MNVPRWNCAAVRSLPDVDWGACCLLVGRRGYARCDNEIPCGNEQRIKLYMA